MMREKKEVRMTMTDQLTHDEQRERAGMRLMRLMMVTAVLSFMSASSFNIVVPEISRQFGITLAQASWLSSGYTLFYGFGTVVYGKLADRFALRPIITIGLFIFTAGSLTGLLSQTFWTALAGRLLQAAGASVVPAMAMILPIRYFAPERRGSAISMTAVGLAIGGVLGPVVSALLLSFANWRWLYVPSLLMLALLPLFRKYLKAADAAGNPQGKLDTPGGGLLLAATAALLLAFTWWNVWLFAAFAAALALFIVHIRRVREPFVRPALFRNRKYRTGLMMTSLIAAASNGVFLLTPMLLADVYHLESQWIGFALVPAAFAAAVLGRRGGKLADRKGNLALYAIAAGLLITCFSLMGLLAGTLPVWAIPLVLMFGNVGQTFIQVAITNSVSGTLPKPEAGVGMGLFSMTNFISNAVSASLYGVAVEAGRTGLAPELALNAGAFNLIYGALAALHIVLLIVYRVRFGAGAARERSVTSG
ncbi:Metal-tetracycline/H+ antiporter [Thermobacillus xylanilyticus]|jgi:DHA2 family metal-tetracycline-proton antiporter-like MFS transporter|uniref:Metal-tetracycline/H+ antiporter n=2 Tax=Thermobacillus xylanilyticus TaxID=76633 RepID=A0ABM8V2D8_THEXY|nr:Metal-tetracycline/H+ antiporter [Thermobacillus xylanilyticus]